MTETEKTPIVYDGTTSYHYFHIEPRLTSSGKYYSDIYIPTDVTFVPAGFLSFDEYPIPAELADKVVKFDITSSPIGWIDSAEDPAQLQIDALKTANTALQKATDEATKAAEDATAELAKQAKMDATLLAQLAQLTLAQNAKEVA